MQNLQNLLKPLLNLLSNKKIAYRFKSCTLFFCSLIMQTLAVKNYATDVRRLSTESGNSHHKILLTLASMKNIVQVHTSCNAIFLSHSVNAYDKKSRRKCTPSVSSTGKSSSQNSASTCINEKQRTGLHILHAIFLSHSVNACGKKSRNRCTPSVSRIGKSPSQNSANTCIK